MMGMAVITGEEREILAELINLWISSTREILATILNREIGISPVRSADLRERGGKLRNPEVLIFPASISGIMGDLYLGFEKENAALMVDLIIGGDGASLMKEFAGLHFGVLNEVISQILLSLSAILSTNLMKKIEINSKDVGQIDNLSYTEPDIPAADEMIEIPFKLKIEDFPESEVFIAMAIGLAREIIRQLDRASNEQNKDPEIEEIVQRDQPQNPLYRKAAFDFIPESKPEKKQENISLIMDLPLNLSAVLGKTEILIKDLVEMGPGSVLELDKLAGDPVEVFVNNRFVALGEVIVIDEKFGIRIIDVVERAERLNTIGR